MLLWAFVGAALATGRADLAELVVQVAEGRLLDDQWPEYYDGRRGQLIGRRAHRNQIWTAAGFIFAHKLLEDESLLELFTSE
jgi:hypothetical protein